ncbi:MAG: MFS transporter [Nanoarchaeota archaeon]|nr:MFS transporter [Nanoarchaeota archaeon]
MNTKSNVFLWALYDFANSLVSIVFFLYFAQWIVVDKGISDLNFNLTFTLSAFLLLLTIPITGVLLDKAWRRITGLRYSTIATFFLYGTCAIFAIADKEILSLIFFTLGLYTYLLSFTFYTPLLNDIASKERRGAVSGWGIMANYLGQIVGLIIALPFSTGSWSFFAGNQRAETLLPAVIAFVIFSLPMLLFFKEPSKIAQKAPFKYRLKQTFLETKALFAYSSVGMFILSFFLFNDAVLTAANNFPIFLEQVWGVSDTVKTYILLGILITSAGGGLISGLIADKFGHKRTLMWILAGWVIILPLVGWVNNFIWFVVSTTLMGLWFGSNWAVSRSVMGYIAPQGKHNLAFAYYGLAERASSLLGPVIWGLIASNLVHMGIIRYRIAVLAITGFIILGLLALSRIRDDRMEEKVPSASLLPNNKHINI